MMNFISTLLFNIIRQSSDQSRHFDLKFNKFSPLFMFIFLLKLLLYSLLLSTQIVHAQYRPQWPSPYVQREIFVLNLEDGYFGCQVNESTDFLQLFELSKLCDGLPQCFQGSDEVSLELKCNDRNQCTNCLNGMCNGFFYKYLFKDCCCCCYVNHFRFHFRWF